MATIPLHCIRFGTCEGLSIDVVRFSPDELYLAVGREQAKIEIYSTQNWNLLLTLPGSSCHSLRNLLWIKNTPSGFPKTLFGYRFLSIGLHGQITEWDLHSQCEKNVIPSYGGAIFDCQISMNEQFLAMACDSGKLHILNILNDFVVEKSFPCYSGRLLSTCWYSKNVLFAGTAQSTILKYNYQTSQIDSKMKVQTPMKGNGKEKGLETQIWCLYPLSKHGLLASGDSLGHVTLWDVRTCTIQKSFIQHQADVLALTATPDQKILYSAGMDSKVTVFTCPIQQGPERFMISCTKYPLDSEIRSICATQSGLVATGGLESTVSILQNMGDLSNLSHQPLFLRKTKSNSIRWVASAYHQMVFFQSNTFVEIWYFMECSNTSSSRCYEPVKVAKIKLDQPDHIICSDSSPDGQTLAISNQKGTFLFKFQLDEMKIKDLPCAQLKSRRAYSMKFLTPDWLLLCMRMIDGSYPMQKGADNETRHLFELVLFDVVKKKVVLQNQFLEFAVHSINTSLDGQWISTIDDLGQCRLYSFDSLKYHCTLPSFLINEKSVATAFHPDGQDVIVFGSNNSYYIYNLNLRAIVNRNSQTPDLKQIPNFILSIQDGNIVRALWLPDEKNSQILCHTTNGTLCCLYVERLENGYDNENSTSKEMEYGITKSRIMATSCPSRKRQFRPILPPSLSEILDFTEVSDPTITTQNPPAKSKPSILSSSSACSKASNHVNSEQISNQTRIYRNFPDLNSMVVLDSKQWNCLSSTFRNNSSSSTNLSKMIVAWLPVEEESKASTVTFKRKKYGNT